MSETGAKRPYTNTQKSASSLTLLDGLPDSNGGVIAAPTQDEAYAGNPAAFMLLAEPILPAAYRLAVAMLRSHTDAEDAVQDAVLKAWRHFGRFEREAEMRPWLLAIVANECRRQRRSRWWTVMRGTSEFESTSAEEPAANASATDLRRAIYRLPHDQRLVLALRYYLDLSFDEVAQVLKITTAAAKSRTYRALERLRLSPEANSYE